jgi:hypothetical protein
MLASKFHHTANSHTWSIQSFSLALYAPNILHLMFQPDFAANESFNDGLTHRYHHPRLFAVLTTGSPRERAGNQPNNLASEYPSAALTENCDMMEGGEFKADRRGIFEKSSQPSGAIVNLDHPTIC